MSKSLQNFALIIALAVLGACTPAAGPAATPPVAQSSAPAAGPEPTTLSTYSANDVALGVASAMAKALGGELVDGSKTPILPSYDAYDGPHRSDSDVAIFWTTKDVLVGLVHDMKGTAIYQSAYDGQTNEIRLKPGSYKMTMLITYERCGGCRKMIESQLDLKAGHVYILDKNEAQYFWWTLEERDLKGRQIGVSVF